MIRAALGRRACAGVPRAFLAAMARGGDVGRRLLRHLLPFYTKALSRLTDSACVGDSRARAELGFRSTTTLHDVMPALASSIVRAA
jgi:hypothetical protein